MKLTTEQHLELFNEMVTVNEENVQGKFIVATKEELLSMAVQFLKDEQYFEVGELECSQIRINWQGEGLYSFWGLGFTSELSISKITEIFKEETGVNPLILLGDPDLIENEKQENWYDYYGCDYIYVIWKNNHLNTYENYLDFVISETALNYFEVLDQMGLNRTGYAVSEINGMDNYEFYRFLYHNYNKI